MVGAKSTVSLNKSKSKSEKRFMAVASSITYSSICGTFLQDLLVKALEILGFDLSKAACLVLLTVLILPHDFEKVHKC